MSGALVGVLVGAFTEMIPVACFIGICTRFGRMLVRVCSGGSELL